jgi:lipoyl(octanoyl) transferase
MDRPAIVRSVEEKAPVGRDLGAGPIVVRWLGRIAYRDAWAFQRALVAARQAGEIPDQLLLLEHDPVITLGRHATGAHVTAPPAVLAERGIEVVRIERGGEVTYHGPGQLVAYPVVGLAGRRLGVRAFVGALEGAMADACAASGVVAGPRAGHPGCWCEPAGPLPRKIGALGIRVSRGVTFHGIALNVAIDLADFGLIDPCGVPGLTSTSIARERGDRDVGPTTSAVALVAPDFAAALARRLGAELEGRLPPHADPARERRALEAMAAAGVARGGG